MKSNIGSSTSAILSLYIPICLQIVVALLEPLQEGGPLTAAAAKAMEELVVKGRSLLQSKLQGLPPLPQSVAGLERVAEVLKQERGALTTDEQVRLLLQSLQHDSASVQATTVQARSPCCSASLTLCRALRCLHYLHFLKSL